MTTRKKQALATKSRIYECATKLFAQHDYDAVTVTDICKCANVAVGVFYYYFSSKDAVIDEGYDYFFHNFQRDLLTFKGTDPLDKIRFIIRTSNIYHEKRGPTYMSVFLKNELNKKNFYDKSQNMLVFIREAVEQAVAEEKLLGDAQTIANDIFKISRGAIYDWLVRNGTTSLQEESLHLIDIVLSHYAKPQ